MDNDVTIWDMSKVRFIQRNCGWWVFGTEWYDLFNIIGIISWVYFEFFNTSELFFIKYISLTIFLITWTAINGRLKEYYGHFDGYEIGFYDGATQITECVDTKTELEFSEKLNNAAQSLLDYEKKLREENHEVWEERRKVLKDNSKKLNGFFFKIKEDEELQKTIRNIKKGTFP